MERKSPQPESDNDDIDTRKRLSRAKAKDDRNSIVADGDRFCRTLEPFLAAKVAAGKFVVVYLAMSDEVDLSPLIGGHERPEQRFAVTRTPDVGFTLSVHPWGEPQEQHPYGYHQPRVDSRTVNDSDIGAVLVPGLAFDHRGRRLGRGKGYYDRFLNRLDASCLRIGITGDYEPSDVPTAEHDVLMTHLAYSDRIVRALDQR